MSAETLEMAALTEHALTVTGTIELPGGLIVHSFEPAPPVEVTRLHANDGSGRSTEYHHPNRVLGYLLVETPDGRRGRITIDAER